MSLSRQTSQVAGSISKCKVSLMAAGLSPLLSTSGVQHVINFDMPKTIEGYIHRIGRTARAGKKGVATSFVTDEDSHLLRDLRIQLVSSNNVVPGILNAKLKSQG